MRTAPFGVMEMHPAPVSLAWGPSSPDGSGGPVEHRLPGGVREELEGYLGFGLERVRIFSGTAPVILGADAFASGDSICVAPEALDFSSDQGLRLLCHELTHVMQARLGMVAPYSAECMMADPELERQAHRIAHDFRRASRQAEWSSAQLRVARPMAEASAIQCQTRGALNTNYIGQGMNPAVPVAPAGVGFSAVNCLNEVWANRALAFARAKMLLGNPASTAKRTYHWYTHHVADNFAHPHGEGLNINGRQLVGPNANQRTGRYYDFGHGKLIVEHAHDPNSLTQTGVAANVQRGHFHIAMYTEASGMYMPYRSVGGVALAGAAGTPGPTVYQIDRRYNFEVGNIHAGGTHEHHHIYYH